MARTVTGFFGSSYLKFIKDSPAHPNLQVRGLKADASRHAEAAGSLVDERLRDDLLEEVPVARVAELAPRHLQADGLPVDGDLLAAEVLPDHVVDGHELLSCRLVLEADGRLDVRVEPVEQAPEPSAARDDLGLDDEGAVADRTAVQDEACHEGHFVPPVLNVCAHSRGHPVVLLLKNYMIIT